MAADLLTKIRSELEARIGDLQSECERLAAAADALGSVIARESSAATPGGEVAAKPARRGRGRRGTAAGALELAASEDSPSPKRGGGGGGAQRASRGAARQAILAALEHGSHTTSELVVVTALNAPNISGNLRRLLQEGAIAKVKREQKTAYALPGASVESSA